MIHYVCNGLTMQCNCRSCSMSLIVLPDKQFFEEKQPAANIMDHAPLVNILPFGLCSSLSNPAVASATSAAQGVLTPSTLYPCNTGALGFRKNGYINQENARLNGIRSVEVCMVWNDHHHESRTNFFQNQTRLMSPVLKRIMMYLNNNKLIFLTLFILQINIYTYGTSSCKTYH